MQPYKFIYFSKSVVLQDLEGMQSQKLPKGVYHLSPQQQAPGKWLVLFNNKRLSFNSHLWDYLNKEKNIQINILSIKSV